jgi:hypothetical protein
MSADSDASEQAVVPSQCDLAFSLTTTTLNPNHGAYQPPETDKTASDSETRRELIARFAQRCGARGMFSTQI